MNNSSNEKFYPLDYWYSYYGYPYIADVITAYIITPVWILSIIFSIFSQFILNKAPFYTSSFFSYMRIYVANCLVLSVISLTLIISNTRRFFVISNTYEAVFFYNYIFMFSTNTLLLFSSIIEISLVIDRILCLLKINFKIMKLISFNKYLFILFIICTMANVPELFLFEPVFVEIQLDSDRVFEMWYVDITSFSFSVAGEIFYYFGYIFRDILPMILKLILNFISVYIVRRYVRNKQKIRAVTASASSQLVKFDRKQTYIALVMNTTSLIEHMLYITSYFLFYIYEFDLSTLIFVIALLFIAIKHLFTFFILFGFNNLFRNEVKNIFI